VNEIFLALISKADNVAVLALGGIAIGLGYLHVVWRREEREDRRQLYTLIEANTGAVQSLRTAISLLVGKEVQ